MNHLPSLPDCELLSSARSLVLKERETTTEIVWHLFEIQRRRLFASLGYSSLHRYCVEELKYCDASAQRRIAAMELIREFSKPEQAAIKEKIESGSLNLSTLSLAQTFIRAEKRERGVSYSQQEKSDLIAQMENKSRRECERQLAAISPSALPRERERVITPTDTEVKFVADAELMVLLRRVKNFAPVECGTSHARLFKWMASKVLKQVDPREKAKVYCTTPPAARGSSVTATPPAARGLDHRVLQGRMSLNRVRSRYIPAALRRDVWQNHDGQCAYVSQSGQRCRSQLRLQIDHIEPYGKGGAHTAENLRLLCPAHNQLQALEAYGSPTMSRFVKSLKG